MFNFDPKTGGPADARYATGAFVTPRGGEVVFLPDEPAQSPPYELIVTQERDESTADGHRHYPIGGDSATVDLIVAFYKSRGKDVPAGYAEEAARHAAAVEAAKK